MSCSIQAITPTPEPINTNTKTEFPTTHPTITEVSTKNLVEFPKIITAIVVNTKTGLNIRVNSSENSSIIFTIPPNERVTILESYPDSNWVMINYHTSEKDYVGFVNKKYLKIED